MFPFHPVPNFDGVNPGVTIATPSPYVNAKLKKVTNKGSDVPEAFATVVQRRFSIC